MGGSNDSQLPGCIAGESRILTPDGYLRIDQVPDSQSQILTDQGIKDFQGIVYHGKSAHLRVRTKLGSDIRVVPDQRMRVLRDNGLLGWMQAQDLAPGDFLLCQRGHGRMIPDDRGESCERWYAIGFFYGDGHQQEGGRLIWQITDSKLESRPRIESFLQQEGLLHCAYDKFSPGVDSRGIKSNEDAICLVTETADRSFFNEIPSYQKKGKWRAVGLPEETWLLGEKQLGALLRGLFDTDGSIEEDGSVISFATIYRLLARDVRKVLHLLGVVTTVHRKVMRTQFGVSRNWILNIVGINSRKFFRSKVGFNLFVKQDRLDYYFQNQTRETDRTFLIPYASLLALSLFPGRYYYKSGDKIERTTSYIIRNVRRRSDGLSEVNLPRVIQRAERLGLSGPTLDLFKLYQQHGWYFDQVKRVDPGYKPIDLYGVYGLDHPSFIANGICVLT